MPWKTTRVESAPEQDRQWEAAAIRPSGGKGRQQIDTSRRYQTMAGFGGAFTEAAAYTLSRMPEDRRTEALTSYFDRSRGLGYSIGRVPIRSCDFHSVTTRTLPTATKRSTASRLNTRNAGSFQ